VSKKKAGAALSAAPAMAVVPSENHNQLPGLFLAVWRPPGIFDVFPYFFFFADFFLAVFLAAFFFAAISIILLSCSGFLGKNSNLRLQPFT
jgi:hypothetical protein